MAYIGPVWFIATQRHRYSTRATLQFRHGTVNSSGSRCCGAEIARHSLWLATPVAWRGLAMIQTAL